MEQANNPQQSTEITPQQLDQIKRMSIEKLTQQYLTFVGNIQPFLCQPKMKEEAQKYFDTGFLWFEKGILNFVIPQDATVLKKESEQPQPPLQPELKDSAAVQDHCIPNNVEPIKPVEDLKQPAQ